MHATPQCGRFRSPSPPGLLSEHSLSFKPIHLHPGDVSWSHPLFVLNIARSEAHLSAKMRVDRCDFSGFKVYPSKGKTYVRGDSKVGFVSPFGLHVAYQAQTFRFLNSKNESLFMQRKNPRKLAWTQVYRR